MTLAPDKSGLPAQTRDKPVETVAVTIDGVEVTVPKGTLVIRAAELLGIAIPRFCDHPLLEPAGACRQCLVDVEGQRKPVASCTQPVTDGMVIRTQLTSPVARKAQEGIMELLLINHPLDCPMCDKGGECPLQNQALANGREDSRFHDRKRTFPKPIAISSQVLLDRERCVLCQRCTRFSDEIAGDPFIDLFERSALEQIGVYTGFGDATSDATGDGTGAENTDGEPFNSYFSGNTVQICPVGALTGAQYRFRSRPFDLVSTPSACEHCAAGCAMRTDWRRGKVLRRLAGDDPEVNEEWNCDKGRWGFQYTNAFDRITEPLVRDRKSGELRQASWPEALRAAAEGLEAARAGGGVGVLTGGRLTVEDAYAYAKFARVVLGTNDIDFRARPASVEETEFLAGYAAGVTPANGGVTYTDVERASTVLLAGLEPEDECPILFLRMRKGYRRHGTKVFSIQPFATRGLAKVGATLIGAAPSTEAEILAALGGNARIDLAEAEAARSALREPGAVILVGERLAAVPGALSAAARLADSTGAKLAWVPRRAGDRGAVDAGCLPNLLPGARPVADTAARAQLADYWGVDVLPPRLGRDSAAMLVAAAEGELGGLLVAGVDPADLPDPDAAEAALDRAGFVVSIELRMTSAARRADVVLPIAPTVEKAGSYLDWEGRLRAFEQVLDTGAMSDARVLDALADVAGRPIRLADVRQIRSELAKLPAYDVHPVAPRYDPVEPPAPAAREAVLATWHHLIDLGSLTDGDRHLAGTARVPVARLSAGTAAEVGVGDGQPLTVSTDRGAVTLPLVVTDMPDRVVWLPTNSTGATVRRSLGVDAGAVVRLASGGER